MTGVASGAIGTLAVLGLVILGFVLGANYGYPVSRSSAAGANVAGANGSVNAVVANGAAEAQSAQRTVVEIVVATPVPVAAGVAAAPAVAPAQAQAAAGPDGSPSQTAPQVLPTQMPDEKVADTLSGARDFARLGKSDAPVKIVVFEDPQCPFCKQMATGSEQDIIKQYVDTGKASLTYRHMAFLGSDSVKIATAMECAGAQDKFWAFHKLVFERQAPENSGLTNDATLVTWAKDAGLDSDKFTACVKDSKAQEAVQADTAMARTLHVTGTPVIFINGRRMVGALPIDMLTTMIDYELKQVPAPAPTPANAGSTIGAATGSAGSAPQVQ